MISQKHRKLIGLCFVIGILALLLWLRSTDDDIELFIPVEISGIPNGLTLTQHPISSVTVLVRGPKYLIQTMSDLKRRYVIDLADVTIGVHRMEIQPGRLNFPEGVTIAAIHPSGVTVEVETEVEKEVPVMVSTKGKPARGFVVADAVARPSSVTLRGPESILGRVEKVMTKSIDVNGLSEPLRKEIALNLSETVVVQSPDTVFLAEIFVEEKIITKAFRDLPVEGTGAASDFTITPATISIDISGPMNLLEKLHAEKTVRAMVDLKGLGPGVYVRAASITLPVNTTLVSVSPEIFTITIP
ncbi:MAG: CdaR family protein [Desulfobacterales bacterium]